MWNLRNKTEEHREREGKIKQDKTIPEWETNHKRLLILGNKLRVARGEEGSGGEVTG